MKIDTYNTYATINSGFAFNPSLLSKTREVQNLKNYFKCVIWATITALLNADSKFTQPLKATNTILIDRHDQVFTCNTSSSGLYYSIHSGCIILITKQLSDGKVDKLLHLYYLSQQTVEPLFRHSHKSKMRIGIGEAHFLQQSMVVPLLPTSGEDGTNPRSSFPPPPLPNLLIQHG